jgi:ABC-type protease/lipase transport system fused ATPase/permease subunit
MAGRTTFVVANRLSLLRRADVILVLQDGRLLQTGTHDELVQKAGPYRETARLQLMDLEQPAADSKLEHSGRVTTQPGLDGLATQSEQAG